MRTAALVIGMYLLVQLVWFAHFLFLVAFLGVLFGLAVAAGVDRLQAWRIPRGVGAAMIVVAFFGLLFGFGAWMAPTLHEQSIELRRRLPDAIDRVETWMNTHRTGVLGLLVNSIAGASVGDSAATASPPAPGAPAIAPPAPVPGAAAQPQRTDSISLPATLRQR